jgi:transcriptional regulator with XRE-family HTH domain
MTHYIHHKISGKFRKLRLAAGYKSSEKFAEQCGLHKATYGRLEKGKHNPTLETINKVLEVHKISLKEFFSDIE